MDVGERLLSLRKAKGLSQRELAKRAGLTNSAISMMETNRVSPSISSLEKVLAAMAMSLSEFFNEASTSRLDYQVVYKTSDWLDVSVDQVTKHLIGKHFIKKRGMNVTHQKFPSQTETIIEASHQVGEKAGYLIEGALHLFIEGEEYSLEAGDSFYFESQLPHCFRNQTNTDAVMLCVCTPNYD